MSDVTTPPLRWRLGVAMAEKDIRTARELRRRLREVGYEISEPQLSRLRKRLPRQLDTSLLVALCRVLAVQPGQLLVLPAERASDGPPPAASEPRDNKNTEQAGPISVDSNDVATTKSHPISGPKLRAIPMPRL